MDKLYRVTDAAPPRVCGRRVAPGAELTLSEAEACYERDLGHLVEVSEAVEPAPVAAIEPAGSADAEGDESAE